MAARNEHPAAARRGRVRLSGAAGQRVGGVRLLRNGVLVRAWRDAFTLDASGSVVLDVEERLARGQNIFSAYAFSADGEKGPTVLLPTPLLVSRDARPRLWIVTIGIDEYADRAMDLRFAAADADLFAHEVPAAFTAARAALTSAGWRERQDRVRKLMQERAVGVTSLFEMASLQWLDESFEDIRQVALRNADATAEAIAGSLRRLANEVTADDTVLVFYAGHRLAIDNRFYLLAHDFTPAAGPQLPEHCSVEGSLLRLPPRFVEDALSAGASPLPPPT